MLLEQPFGLENRRILVTGADGFIGSHLVQALVKQKAKVRALALYNSFNHWGWLEGLAELDQIEVVTGDIRDVNTCRRITKEIDIIFHLAALIAIPYSYLAPEAYIATNVLGTANLCQAALDNGVERFIHTSTSEVYGTAKYIPMDENHPLQPQSPYSASKIGADSIALSYFFSFGLPLIIVRPFNTYGPRQSARAVIPSILMQLAEGKREIAIGNSSPTRDFTYVEDTCQSFIRLALSEQAVGETINVGTGVEISIEELSRKIAALLGQEVELVSDPTRVRSSASEVHRLCCNSEKLRQFTAFVPQISLEEGLKRTIDWFLENQSRYKSAIYNV